METLPFQDPDLPPDVRARDLVSRMSLEEKAGQMVHEAPGITRLGIPPYNWWNEGLHGVARAGVATVFPQAIALAATWNVRLVGEVAAAVADEARAKHHEFVRHEDRGLYKGLTFWAPNINIFRDPRWGRGHETYGECPHLTARLGVSFCRGLQGDHPTYFKVVATPKHFAVHSGPEALRHAFDARVTVKDLRETYLPAFHACLTEGGAHSVMAAYNRTNGEPCAGSRMLAEIIRSEWGFGGYVVSDCWAIRDFHEGHGVTRSWNESAAMAVKAGCDLNCGCAYRHIPAAVEEGLLREDEVDACVTRLFVARMRLGMFDPPDRVLFASTPYEVNDSAEHRALARRAARESIVLLKNDRGLLPLSKDLARIAVIGPTAHDPEVLRANYFGLASASVTPLDGIRAAVSRETKVWYTDGCKLLGTKTDGLGRAGNLSEALSMAERADAVVLCVGLSADIEGEQGDAGNSEAGGDKRDLRLTGLQNELLEAVVRTGKPTVLAVLSGSPLDLAWADAHVPAIVQAFYPGEEGGAALADVLFGDASPSGRLPVTFPRSTLDLPPIEQYAMAGRTYRYLERDPLYPFGYGLSYTRFRYDNLVLSRPRIAVGEGLEVSATVGNVGARAGDEVAQLYIKALNPSRPTPRFDLRGFERLTLQAGESRQVTFRLAPRDLSQIDERGARVAEPGRIRIFVGGSQPDPRSFALTAVAPLSADLEVVGTAAPLPY